MDHRPRKRFGQNFLHDPGTIRRIIGAVNPKPGQRLVEIGPGRGAITEGLLRAAGALDVIELDRDLIAPLRERLAGLGALRIHNADALSFDLCSLCAETDRRADSPADGLAARPADGPADRSTAAGGRLRIVGNLPYNISTPLLFRFLEQARCIEDLHLMLQKEVVERICAAPGSKVYGRLSVMVQTWCGAERLFVIGPGAFTPPPRVDSAVVRLLPYRPPPWPLADPALHRQIVAAAFSQRRKTLRNSLSGLITPEQLMAAGIDPSARAETLSVADFVRLANACCIRPGPP
jgi:16S rRNA (adenine1518-N6/adenine1519-N6)-dimethyltransferase